MDAWWETYFEADGWQRVQLGVSAEFDDPAQAASVVRALGLEPAIGSSTCRAGPGGSRSSSRRSAIR